jgi:ATP-dependent DNA helicase RecG
VIVGEGVGWETRLRGVIGRLAPELEEHLGLRTVGDLLSHYPRTFLELDQVSDLAELVEGELVSLVAEVTSATIHPYQDKRTRRTAYRTEVSARLGDGQIWMTFFDKHQSAADWRTGKLTRGKKVLLAGKFGRNSFKRDRWELTHPEVDEELDDAKPLKPVYPIGGKLKSSAQVERAVRAVLAVVTDIPERIPEWMRKEHDLLGADTAIRWIHQPDDWQQYGAAVKRLRFDEAFVAQVALAQRRHEQRQVLAEPRTGRPGGIFDAFAARMPFDLTAGQQQVEEEILQDLSGGHPMHRLLQGEVGSGKTVVALRAMLRVVDSGGQAALLAPTEVLAQQHHRSISAMLGELAGGGMLGSAPESTKVALLTGSLRSSERKEALLEAASGEAGIVIGTHALLEDRVQFADLGLVVVDEQHRFGVEQRAALSAKSRGVPPHALVMTATPIPRTVAMTVFGDLETSALRELPAGRSPIQTNVVPVADQPSWLDRAWSRAREEVAAGRQVYVVCPRISGDDKPTVTESGEELFVEESSSDRPPLAAVEEVAPGLADGPLDGLRVAMLHGRLPPEEKDRIMRSFSAGDVDVLVSTTVIEVGVDVGNATTMIVLDADRFGMSQLHQLRGRVGRGGHPGLCLLVTTAAPGSSARVRLDAVAGTLDGFRLAELDLELRREGDVLGSTQSGNRRTLRLLSVVRDVEVIEVARSAAVDVVERDPELAGEPVLRAAVAALHATQVTEFLDKT